MPIPMIERPGGAVLLVVEGALRPDDARMIEGLCDRLPPASRVEVDFRQVHESDGVALATLARVLLDGRVGLTLRGTTRSQEAALRYFGVPPPTAVGNGE